MAADLSSADVVTALPIIEETATLSKVTVDRGGYRITRHVSEREETVVAPLRQDTYRIERRPVHRPVDGAVAPEPRYEGQTLVIPVVEEILVTEKRLVVVEEIHIIRTETVQSESRQVSLRREDIEVVELPPRGSLPAAVERDRLGDASAPRGNLPKGSEP